MHATNADIAGHMYNDMMPFLCKFCVYLFVFVYVNSSGCKVEGVSSLNWFFIQLHSIHPIKSVDLSAYRSTCKH